jgi:hypothetical protein
MADGDEDFGKPQTRTGAQNDFGPRRPRFSRFGSKAEADGGMISHPKSRSGGGKLARSETVTVRLDPKLRYFAELAARKQRRTLSSFIEWAIELSLDKVHFADFAESSSIASELSKLWDVDEVDRFAKLALSHPDMLLHEEQVLWKLIRENGYVWKGYYDRDTRRFTWVIQEEALDFERLREYWDAFRSVAYENGSKAGLPTWKKERPPSMDDEIPF